MSDGEEHTERLERLDRIAVRVPAKINLLLGVGEVRPDGFHELVTVFQAVSLYDVITASATAFSTDPALPSTQIALSVAGPEVTGVPNDHRNLAWQAATALATAASASAQLSRGLDLRVYKAIPVAAGLAGGSADAAGALLACDRLWNLETPPAALDALAAQLGSDVTFALHGRTALGLGRGEQLSPITTEHQFHWVLAAADIGLSTPAVYREFDRQRAAGIAAKPAANAHSHSASDLQAAALIWALEHGDVKALAAVLGNDLQPAALALAPSLRDTLAAGKAAGALAGLVSGSGPTCAFLASDEVQAAAIASALNTSGTCRFAVPVLGNVDGAHVEIDPIR